VNLATEKARMIARREVVKDTDPEEHRNICERLVELEEIIKEKKISGAQAFAVANINNKNKAANFSKSIAIVCAFDLCFTCMLTNLQVASKEEQTNNDLDPFARRKTLPRIQFASKTVCHLSILLLVLIRSAGNIPKGTTYK
jgi:hypothetical protein